MHGGYCRLAKPSNSIKQIYVHICIWVYLSTYMYVCILYMFIRTCIKNAEEIDFESTFYFSSAEIFEYVNGRHLINLLPELPATNTCFPPSRYWCTSLHECWCVWIFVFSQCFNIDYEYVVLTIKWIAFLFTK